MLRKLLVVVSLLVFALPGTVLGAPRQETSATGYAIVTLVDEPIATYAGGKPGLERTKPLRGKLDPSSPAYQAYERFLANEHANYRAKLAQRAPQAVIVGEYDTVLNGFAIQLNGASLAALRNDPKVKHVEASWLYSPTMNVSVDVIKASDVWAAGGGQANAGAGINVGIIDSGIRDDHVFFACKDEIPHKTYAAGSAGTGVDIVNTHGTHVAGTVAGCVTDLNANDTEVEHAPGTTISGVAPGANLFDYNVFPGYGGGFVAFGGSAFSHDIALAVEDAVNDGMDIINLSLGGPIQGEHDYLAEAINSAAAAGVVPAVSAGNEGPLPETVGSPGNAPAALTAGATTNPHYVGVSVVVTPGGAFGAAVGDFDPFAAKPAVDRPFVSWGGNELACSGSSPATSVTDAVVLIRRGTCTFQEKVESARAAGAFGVVVYNNVGGDPVAMGGTSTIPAVMVSNTDGATIKTLLTTDPAGETVSIDGNNPVEVLTTNSDIMAGFSSRGPAEFTENIKPDFTAPGVNVYSSVFDDTVADGELGWAMFQGTSMASPHVAGAAALLLQQRPGLSPADVKSLLGNNADRNVWATAVGGTLAKVMDRGGGRIDLVRASAATTTFDPMSLSFGISNGNRPNEVTISVTIHNLSGTAKTLALSETDPNITLSAPTVSVAPNGTATFSATLRTRGAAAAEGDITATETVGGTTTYLLPFWYSNGN